VELTPPWSKVTPGLNRAADICKDS
jgi:hypothetical protein